MKTVILSLTVVLTFILSSCGDKCTTCTFTYEVGGDSVSATQPEVCGSKSVINEYKDNLQTALDQVATASGGINASSACVDN